MKKDLKYYTNLDYEIITKKISKNDGDGWFAYYKDFKGIMGDGETPQEAISEALEAFKAFVEVALSNGDTIALPNEEDKTVRINITMPSKLVKKIDEYIAPLHITRSAFLQKLAKGAI
jgi:predicted RNase H-like HicB family nuclease